MEHLYLAHCDARISLSLPFDEAACWKIATFSFIVSGAIEDTTLI